MEQNNITSCLMWGIGLYTPINLSGIFEQKDLKDTGVNFDSHITLLFVPDGELDKTELLTDIQEASGKYWKNLVELSSKFSYSRPVMDLFDLGGFENDSDYLVLELKPGSHLYNCLSRINEYLRDKYSVPSKFKTYRPHITLAELEPGTVGKYLNKPELRAVLEDTTIDFEDFILSYGYPGKEDFKYNYLTQYKAVDRYFRIEREKIELL